MSTSQALGSMQKTVSFTPVSVRHFSGRKFQLDSLEENLRDRHIVVITPKKGVICAIGKSALAIQYALDRFPYFIPAKNKKTIEESYRELSKSLGIDVSELKASLCAQQALVVFDDVQDPALLKEYLPGDGCDVIVTSRIREWSFPLIEMGPFSAEEAVEFLHKYTGQNDEVSAKNIAEELDYLPTSLIQTGEDLIQHDTELKGYLGLRDKILQKHADSLQMRSNLGDRNLDFIGRERYLVALEEALKINTRAVIRSKKEAMEPGEEKRRVTAEVGLGGIGKTEIAKQYAFRNAPAYPTLVWIVDCQNEISLQASYVQIAEKIGIKLAEDEKSQPNILIAKVNSHLEQTGGWLLIFDDAEDQASLESVLPKRGGHVLIASRNPNWDLDSSALFTIEVFDRRESIALIRRMAPLDAKEADQLAELVQDLPIAVAQAAAYIKQTSISYAEYEKRFNEKLQRLLSVQKPTDTRSTKINVIWELSMEKIDELEQKKGQEKSFEHPVARPLMNFCSFLSSTNIPIDSLLLPWMEGLYHRGLAAASDIDDALQLLRRFSMISRGEDSLTIHELVQGVTRTRLPENKRKEICSQAVLLFERIMAMEENNALKIKKNLKLIPHAEKIVDHGWDLRVEERRAVNLRNNTSFYLRHQGSYNHAESSLRRSLKKCIELVDISMMITLHNNLATLLRRSKKYEESKKVIEEGITLALGFGIKEDDPQMAYLYVNLGNVLSSLGNHELAQKYYEKSFALLSRPHLAGAPSDPMLVLDVMLDLANIRCLQKDYISAKKWVEDALLLTHENSANTRLQVANLKHMFGIVLHKLNKLEEATKEYEEAIRIKEEFYPPNSEYIAGSCYNLGKTLLKRQMYDAACVQLKRAAEIYEITYSPDHTTIGGTHNRLGAVYLGLGKYALAENHFRRALKVLNQNSSTKRRDLADLMSNLGASLHHQGKNHEAEKILNESLEMKKQMDPPDPLTFVATMNNLGAVLRDLKRYEPARKILEDALTIYQHNECKDKDAHIADVRLNLGVIFSQLGGVDNNKKARDQFKLAVDLYKKSYPKGHPHLALALKHLGTIYNNLEEYHLSYEYYQEALKVYQKINFPSQFPEFIRLRYFLADSCLNSGSEYSRNNFDAKAEKLFKEGVIILRQLDAKNIDDPLLEAKLLNSLGVSFDKQGPNRWSEAMTAYTDSLKLKSKLLPPNDPSIMGTIGNLARLQQKMQLLQSGFVP